MSAETDRVERENLAESDRRLVQPVALGRRRLLRGGLSAAPVIMTFVSGPVSAGLCTTGSAYGSMHPSGKQASIACGGRSPAAWTRSAPDWHCPIGANDLFKHYFRPALRGAQVTLQEVLDESNRYDEVARNCVAALLNASTSPLLTPAAVLDVARAKAIWSSYATKGYFEPTAGIHWNRAQIVDWMTTTYS